MELYRENSADHVFVDLDTEGESDLLSTRLQPLV